MSDTKAEVRFLLDTIDSWSDIAQKFEELGIKGFKSDACSCPVANYVRKFADVSGFSVGPLGAYWVAGCEPKDSFNGVSVPARVQTFMDEFDQGQYPQLEMTHEEIGAHV